MGFVFRSCLLIAGVINFLPSVLAFIPDKIGTSYGIEVLNPNLELLLSHRAILFGIIGGLMIYSAITKKHYSLAVIIGLISMSSFIILANIITGDINPELTKVMKIDVVGLVILLFGYGWYRKVQKFYP